MSNEPTTRYPTLETASDRRLWDALTHLAGRTGFTVAVRRLRPPLQAITAYETKQVVIADNLDRIGALTQLAHELAHVRLHATILRPDQPQDRALRELEAELVACTVLLNNRVEPASSSADLIANRAFELAPDTPAELATQICERLLLPATKICDAVRDYIDEHPLQRRPNPSAATPDPSAVQPDGPGL
ncbi:ImmA/IrrE family metallo-endopeptidase [Kribbella sandramycini]|uniref:ImmA/IrrE family metallo-endopeptidase n=1 Tax=Kribbella sandramycini TaxID=60450 RepID=A0A7Y4L949_9ACTN|nr:ImmA/IrrE family metallo-endopeptidase [Kribbella sandramycini]MBB6566693.1 hypothetical protein [Kribbella sandramycini]NOL45481.1 ImmA/IrrE family metallo-endopeptidase [Kribbella sandramycini]